MHLSYYTLTVLSFRRKFRRKLLDKIELFGTKFRLFLKLSVLIGMMIFTPVYPKEAFVVAVVVNRFNSSYKLKITYKYCGGISTVGMGEGAIPSMFGER